jgi:photosystem II stability/assembly factor-like uncharacterized protein
MKTRLIFFLLVFVVKLAFSQMNKPILGTNYRQYVKEMDAYYATRDKGKGTGYKQYMRWQHINSSLVGTDNQVKNFEALNFEAYKNLSEKIIKNAKVEATHGLWEDLGPHDFSGSDSFSNNALARVNCVEFHPTNPNIIWVGTPTGGLWKTTDHGGTWTCISNDFASIGINDIVVNQANPNVIYILTGDGDSGVTHSIGVLKTSDGGLNWKETGLKFGVDQTIIPHVLRMHPTNSDILFATTNFGIYKTVNGGNTWTLTNNSQFVWDLEFKPGDPNTIYSVCENGILKSVNGGDTFIGSNTDFPTDPMATTNPKTWIRLSLAVSPSAPNNIYVLCGGVPSSGMFSGVYKSTNSGASWSLQGNSPNILANTADGGGTSNQAGYDLTLAVDPTNDARIFVGAVNCWKSDNNGVNWSRETNWQRAFGAVDPFVHADFHGLKFRGSRLYACNDGGIYYTDDFGHSWGDISSGIGATQFYNISIDGAGYIGGTQDNGTNEATFGNMQMHNIAGGDGFSAIWHNSNHSIQYLSSQDVVIRRQLGSNIIINSNYGSGEFWDCILKNATNNDGILWAKKLKTKLIRGNQMNDISFATWNWYETGNEATGLGELKGYTQSISSPGLMYAAHEFNLIKTTNVYATPAPWTVLTSPDLNLYFEDIISDPSNSNRIWVVCGGFTAGKKVFYSPNGGTSWSNISGTLPNIPVLCISKQAGSGDKLYIGTSIGVFYKESTMTDWNYYSNNLPNVRVEEIQLNSTHVFAGTYGRGVWRSELYNPCLASLNLTPANETFTNIYSPGTQEHSASVSIQSTRVYNGSVGTNIYYNGGQFVDLKPGFEIKTDAFMEVKNKGCPD